MTSITIHSPDTVAEDQKFAVGKLVDAKQVRFTGSQLGGMRQIICRSSPQIGHYACYNGGDLRFVFGQIDRRTVIAEVIREAVGFAARIRNGPELATMEFLIGQHYKKFFSRLPPHRPTNSTWRAVDLRRVAVG